MKFRNLLLLASLLVLDGCRPAVWYDLRPGVAARVEKQTTVPVSFNVKDPDTGKITRVEENYPVPVGDYVIQLNPASQPTK